MKRIFINGGTKSDQGGIMLVAIVLLVLFSGIFIRYTSYLPLWNQHVANTEQYYQEQILCETTIIYLKHHANLLQKEGKTSGLVTFNLGEVAYQFNETSITLTVKLATGKPKVYTVDLKEEEHKNEPPTRLKEDFPEF